VDEQATDGIQLLRREAPFVEDRAPLERRNTAGDNSKGLTGGVVVDRLDRP
jgi:hypothetical protein